MNEIKSCEWCHKLVGRIDNKFYHLNRKNNLKCLRIRYGNEHLAVDNGNRFDIGIPDNNNTIKT